MISRAIVYGSKDWHVYEGHSLTVKAKTKARQEWADRERLKYYFMELETLCSCGQRWLEADTWAALEYEHAK